MGTPPSFFDLTRGRRSCFLTFVLCCLGIMGCYSVLNSEDPKVFLKPAQNLLGIVRPQRLLGAPISDLTHLERHNLSSQFSYSRRLIKTKHFSGARPELTNLSQTDLFGTPQVFNAEDLQNVKIHNELAPLTLAVPYSPKVDTSIMSFGIATTADRIPDAIPNLLHWLPRTESSLHILVPPDQKISSLQQQMRDLQIKTTIKSTPHPFAKAYFSLIKELYDARTPKTKWLVLIDDDTFAPSLPALVSHLNQAYDANEQLILAAISDNMQQIHMFGLLPFGGGGIFVSVPLAAKLTEQKTWDACLNLPNNQGDQIVRDCLVANSHVRPIFDQGLNQMDISGKDDPAAGYFESGRQMLTIHHWRSWYDVDMPSVGLVSAVCGYEGILMRWLFGQNFVLSNGYSIVEYPQGIEKVALEMVEQTWAPDEPKTKFEHKIGPLRGKMREGIGGEKRTLRMVDAEIVKGWGVRQTYVERTVRVKAKVKEEEEYLEKRETEEDEDEKLEDRVVELVWLF